MGHLRNLMVPLSLIIVYIGTSEGSVGCGTQASNFAPKLPTAKHRVINGQEARQHSWPWAVLHTKAGGVFCGGTLIRVKEDIEESDIVLTAAHCIDEKDKGPSRYEGWTVTAGSQWRKKPVDGQQTRNVIKAQVHEDYKPVKNDIAMLLLDKPIQFSDTIRPPCLPEKDAKEPIGQSCVVGGWGRNNSDNPRMPSDSLQQSVEPVNEASDCEKPWGGSFKEGKMLCVGNLEGKSGVCNGDSGGMLVCKDDSGKWVQEGVLSFVGGKGRCIAPGWPSVYTKVSAYKNWIEKKIKEMSSLVK